MRFFSTVLVLCAVLCGFTAEAAQRRWERYEVPGAYCGDGSPYAIFVSRKNPSKLAVTFMGGGACWDRSTCWGPTPLAWIHGFPFTIELFGGIFNPDQDKTIAADYTMVHFPYCTGDVHLGRHKATYGGLPVWHYGAINVEKGLDYFVDQLGFDPYRVKDLVMYGYSAGAIAGFSHIDLVDGMFPAARTKTFLADSPGLHFGKNFWKKFSPEWQHDMSQALAKAGLQLDTSKGLVAEIVGTVCKRHRDWEIGVLQGSKDIIMSRLFGEISMEDHHKLVFGPGGLWEQTREPGDNCSAWIPTSAMHTFLFTDASAGIEAGGVSAWDFSNAHLRQAGGSNFRD